jgi:hypothetical protein
MAARVPVAIRLVRLSTGRFSGLICVGYLGSIILLSIGLAKVDLRLPTASNCEPRNAPAVVDADPLRSYLCNRYAPREGCSKP